MTDDHYEDEIELRDLILMVWRGRRVIALAVLGAAFAATLYCTYLRQPMYEARVSFVAPDLRLADGTLLKQQDYLPLFRKESITEELVHRHGLSSGDTQTAMDRLLSGIKPEPQKDASVVAVSFRHRDRDVALGILDDYAGLMQSEVASLAAALNTEHVQRLETSLEARRSAYHAVLEELNGFQKAHDIAGMKSTLSDRQSRLLSAERRIDELKSKIETLNVSLAQASSQLAATDPLIVTKDVLDGPSVKMLDQLDDSDVTSIPAIERELPNPTYTQLLEVVHTSQRQLESSRAELQIVVDQVSALREEITNLRQTLADAEQADAELRLSLKHAQSSYEDAASLYSSAVNASLSTSYSISTASGPWASTSPVGSSRLMMAALAAVLAGFVSVMLLFFVDYMRAGERQFREHTATHMDADAPIRQESAHVAEQ